MTNLRNSAKGEDCLIRLPGICNGNPATTVLAHYRLIGISGLGLKSPDMLAAFACSACHDYVDSRRISADLSRDQVKLAHLEGVMRTQAYWLKQGYVKVVDKPVA